MATYSITYNLKDVKISGSAPQSISTGGTVYFVITSVAGHNLPESITVENATHSYAKTTGFISISNPTDNVVVTINGLSGQESFYEDMDALADAIKAKRGVTGTYTIKQLKTMVDNL